MKTKPEKGSRWQPRKLCALYRKT